MLTPLCDSRSVLVLPRTAWSWVLLVLLGIQVSLFGKGLKGGGNSDSQSGPEATLTNGLWAHYPLDGNASDNSGNGHHGESNQTQLTHDRFGRPNRAFDFDGNNSAVYLPIGSEFNSSVDSLSVSLWAKVRDPSRGTLFEQGTQENLGRDILAFADNNLTSRVGGPLFSKAVSNMNEWRHYLVTYDVTKGSAVRKFYVDGQLFGSDSNDTLENSSLNFILGRDFEGNRPLEGSLDSVRIWRRALSSVQVAALYQIESVNPTPPKVEVSGSVSYDGVVPGPIRVLAYRPNGNLAAQTLLSTGESAFSLSLTNNRSYDLFAFQDRDENGSYNAYLEPGDHYGGWNKSSQSFDLLSVEGNRTGIQLHLTDLDSDEDGYENWHEYQAGTAINDRESKPGMGFGLMGRWRIRGDFNATIENSAQQNGTAILRNEHNASARYYEVAHQPAYLMDSGAVTIFLRHDSITGRQGYLSKDARGLKTGGHLSIYQQDGNLTVRLQSASKGYSIQVPDCIVPNRWIHLVFQWGPGGMTLWLNGQSVGSDPYTGGLGPTSGGIGNEEPLFIGAGGWKYENEDLSTVVGVLDGEVHLALLHSRKLIPLEIAVHHHRSRIAVNRSPYGMNLDQRQVSENQSAGTFVGVLNAMDDDYRANLTYALNYNGQGGPFAVQPDGNVVTTRPIDYEETPQLELFAMVSDEYNATHRKKFVIEVLDLKDTPNPVESPSSDSTEEETDSNTQSATGQSENSENEETVSSASGESVPAEKTNSSVSYSPQTTPPSSGSTKDSSSKNSDTEESNENLDSDSQNTSESSNESSSVDHPPKSEEPGAEKGIENPGPGSGPKEPDQPATPEESHPEKSEGKKPGKAEEETVPEMPEGEKETSERDPGKQRKEPGKPGSEKEDDLTKESGKPLDSKKSDLEKSEGKKPGKDMEKNDSQMPKKEKETAGRDPGKQPKEPEEPGSEKEDDLTKQSGKPLDSKESDLEKSEGKKPGKDMEKNDSQMPKKEKETAGRDPGKQPKEPEEPGSEKEDDLTKQSGKPLDSKESDLEKGEGKKPAKVMEKNDSQMPKKEKETAGRDPGKQPKEPEEPGSEKEDDLTKQSGKPLDSKESDLEKSEGKKPGKDMEKNDSQMPKKEKETAGRDPGNQRKEPEEPVSEKEDDLTKQPGKPLDSKESDLEKSEGKKPGKDMEKNDSQMPKKEKETAGRDPGKQPKEPEEPGSEKEDDLTKQSAKPLDSKESDLEKGEGKKPGKDKAEPDLQLPEKEFVKPEEEESKNEKKARLPIVRTLRFDRDENGTFVLAGELLTDGGGTLEEVGILISEKFSFKDCECKPVEIKGKEGIFRKRMHKLEAGSTYYYQAYARNEVGENRGSIRKLKVLKVEERKAWWSESLDMGGGWHQSEWLGAFRKSEGNDWIFHLQLGWVFARPDSDSGLWLWLEEYGWLWTQKDAWPYLWANQSADWLYFVTQLRGEALFLRPSDGQLILQGREFRTGSEKQRETEPSGKEEFTKEPGRSSEGKEKTKQATDHSDQLIGKRKTQGYAETSEKQPKVRVPEEVDRDSTTDRSEGKSERKESGDLGREETISKAGKREEGKERATDNSTLGKQTEREISERPEMERESMTDRTADKEPVSDRISDETERDGKLDREPAGNEQTISENREDLSLEREDQSRERNYESTLILERTERSKSEDKQFLPVSAEG